MRLIIDLVSINKGGAEQVAISFLNEFKSIIDNEYHIFLRENISKQINKSTFSNNFFFYEFTERPGAGLFPYIRTLRRFRKISNNIIPDCVLYTSGQGYWIPNVPLILNFNIPHFVYPESPYFSTIGTKKKIQWSIKKCINLYFYKRSNAITVQTNDVKDRLEHFISNVPIHTLPNAVNSYFFNSEKTKPKLPPKKTNEKRLLMVSSYYPHKNIKIIGELINEMIKRKVLNVKFVLTLPEDIFLKIFGPETRNSIYNVGPIPIKECPSLYEECDFMFLPTLLECFSASYIEAMATGLPILTSDLGFAHCVCGDAAEYFDPLNATAIVNTIINLCNNLDRQKELIRNGKKQMHSFPKAESRAANILSICHKLCKNNN